MNISLNTKKTLKGHSAFLVHGQEALPEGFFTSEKLGYYNQETEAKKKIIVFNNYTYTEYVIVLPKKNDPLSLEECRKLGDDLWLKLKEEKNRDLSVFDLVSDNACVKAFLEGFALGSYSYAPYKVKEKDDIKTPGEVELVSGNLTDAELERLLNVVKAVNKARDLVNEPVKTLTARALSDEFEKMAEESGMTAEVFGKKKIEALRMGGLLGVNMGSPDEPTFTVLEWKPENAVNDKPVVLVGKGVVYDTGGMNIKTGNYMEDMKSDMGGAAAVGGAIYAAALAKLPVHIITLVPATDNRVDGNAIVSGDILTMHSGATVEVINTDAEGRLILADALSYARQFDPMVVIDAATLTGAAMRAIGKYATVGMQSKASEVFLNLQAAGDQTGERLVEFPLWDDYKELLKSPIADIRNISTGAEGGAITAGKFLEYFTDYPYIHLDIAGTAFMSQRYGYRGVGATGVGVRMLFRMFENMC